VAQERIFTPDRRLRVFVSSTLRELALERAAAREAISSLRLAPVLFEQGARPHAPRDLYAAYVGQCDVFVGIYWQSYGWVAPGAGISGLEDELGLAQGKPMLLYIKEPAGEREDRLRTLIRRIEDESGPAYRTFSRAEELRALVADDLAVLLTERFQTSTDGREEPSALPARTTSFVGREQELEDVVSLVERNDVRLVTLIGPGGIGKTRLAVEAARRVATRFSGGAAYVPLDRLADPELVPVAIADAVGLPSLGPDPEAGLVRFLRERQLLLVLDSFEHLLDAAPLVTRLLEACGDIEALVTSREPLRLQGEHEYGVPPLADAPRLFVERVGAVRPDIEWDDENMRAADEICRRVDRLPLAVELVAAGARMLAPRVLVEHLVSSLDVPSAGRRDAPARQQTVRATIDWSYGLLADSERDLFERLGAFASSFTIEAAGAVAGQSGPAALSTLSALVDKSLLQHAPSESETRFRMLQVVAEYAAEKLRDRTDAGDIESAHAAYYEELARAAHSGLRGREQRGWKEVLDLESENVRRAVDRLARLGRADDAAELVWPLWVYWMAGRFLEGRNVVGQLLASPGELSEPARARLRAIDGFLAFFLADLPTARAELGRALEWFEKNEDEEGRAVALLGLGFATAPFDADRARDLILEGARLLAGVGDRWAEAIGLSALSWLDVGRGDFTERDLFERGYVLAREVDDDLVKAHTATNLAELKLALGPPDEVRELLAAALAGYEALRLYDGLSYSLETAARLAANEGRFEEAARLLGAADGLREEAGVPMWGAYRERSEELAGSVRDALGERFPLTWTAGRALGFDSALAEARQVL
jgi:predicted ATPase